MEIKEADILLCEFYFSDLKKSKQRPVLVLKDNLPYNDFIAIPISSKIHNLHQDELLLENKDFLNGSIPVASKVMTRKTFVVSKDVVLKKYGTLTQVNFAKYHGAFCNYFQCNQNM
ncbi:MAG: type II toxin-antitoxin system PemK/MazF family toxin [Sulfurimonas sp.]|jgi:mRNA interferase MazF|nr:type II toxin-antitoxin system PemK/MazF family toxin [Sulfurimonas sp.]